MKALSLASNDEKAELKSECRRALDAADMIKKTGEWRAPASSNNVQATVAPSLPQSVPRANTKSTAAEVSCPSSPTSPSSGRNQASFSCAGSEGPHQFQSSSTGASKPANGKLADDSTKSPEQASNIPTTRVRRLREPTSTRKRTTQESIILLKASIVNEFKFPPWNKDPPVDDFASTAGTERFR